MNDDNKKRISMWLKVAALFIIAIINIVTCAGVWNYCDEPFVCNCAIALFIIDLTAVVYLGIKLKDKNETKESK